VIPAAIIASIALPAFAVIYMEKALSQAGAAHMDISITGHQ